MSDIPVWKGTYRQIVDGQQVRASVTNRATDDIFQQLLYLKNNLDAATAGKALVLPDQTMSATLTAGMAVYLDTSRVWQGAIAELSNTPNSSLFQLTKKAYVTGVVTAKGSPTNGTVAIQGEVLFSQNDILSVIEGTYESGAIYYLSPYTPGKITKSKGVAPVRVCLINGPDANNKYRVLINPDQHAILESHGHYRFTLVDAPAGEPNCVPGKAGFMWGDLEPDGPYPGIVHEVINPDTALRGWLPADNAAFDGLDVPDGAKFGYNIAMDDELAELWPPLPITGVTVEVDGIDVVDDTVIINSDGIWWMDNTYGKAPWPVNLPCSSSSTSSSSSTPYPVWPIRIDLWCTRMLHGTTITAIDNRIQLVDGILPDMSPVAVGANILSTVLSSVAAQAYVLPSPYPAGSSSSTPSSSVPSDAYTLLYRLTSRDYQTYSRRVLLKFELQLGGSSACTYRIMDIMAGLAVSLVKMPATNAIPRSYADVTSTNLTWARTPTNIAGVPADAYFTLQTSEVYIDTSEVMYILLSWSPSALSIAGEEAYLFSIRPIITVE